MITAVNGVRKRLRGVAARGALGAGGLARDFAQPGYGSTRRPKRADRPAGAANPAKGCDGDAVAPIDAGTAAEIALVNQAVPDPGVHTVARNLVLASQQLDRGTRRQATDMRIPDRPALDE
ncbi:hypothetical protein [Nakamurella lactea]|uniref:hypothetical protein n=1 Tax=Nakamurella lactea TaxID=459515 RepID=UPI0012B5C735|nr:hypothetical protein [Nakamurella lactea]